MCDVTYPPPRSVKASFVNLLPLHFNVIFINKKQTRVRQYRPAYATSIVSCGEFYHYQFSYAYEWPLLVSVEMKDDIITSVGLTIITCCSRLAHIKYLFAPRPTHNASNERRISSVSLFFVGTTQSSPQAREVTSPS